MDQIEKKEEAWIAVVNPHAGSGKTISGWKKAQRMLDAKGIGYRAEMTGHPYNAAGIAFNSAVSGYRKFIAVGGDGTVHDVLGGIMAFLGQAPSGPDRPSLSDFTLAVIPIGSGNDWIRVHNIPRDPEKVVGLIASGAFSMQDVVKVTFKQGEAASGRQEPSYMINVGGIGIDSRICRRVNELKARGASGKLLYVSSLLHNLFRYMPSSMRIVGDGNIVFEGPCFSVAFGVGKYSGGGMRQTPDAVLDDGLLDMTVIPPLPAVRILREAYRLFNGSLLAVREVVHGRYRRIEVTPLGDRSEIVEVDGEVPGRCPVCFEVLPEQIRVLHASR